MKPQAPRSLSLNATDAGRLRQLGGKVGEVRLIGGKGGEVRLIGGKGGEVRLIGGLWKRSKLSVPHLPGLRPTPSRVRETLFNWLGQDLAGLRCVDAFAGSGALGFEAASRGAQDVLLVEQNPQLVVNLEASQARLRARSVRVRRGDGVACLRSLPPQSVDVIFLDPPFHSDLLIQAVQAAALALSPQGVIYLEAPEIWGDDRLEPLALAVVKQSQAGTVFFHLLRKK